jgi:hypothetical protein
MNAEGISIGEMSERAGFPAETLRAWERRYGLFSPQRTGGGVRRYGALDIERGRQMGDLLRAGWAPGRAARHILSGGAEERTEREGPLAGLREDIWAALVRMDGTAISSALDAALVMSGTDAVLRELILSNLRRLGDEWAAGRITIAQEHYGSNLMRARLLAVDKDWLAGLGPLALLACPAGELHDLPLVAFGLALRQRGWRVACLGADTPLLAVDDAVRLADPQVVVLYSADWAGLGDPRDGLSRLGSRGSLYLAAESARELAEAAGASLLSAGLLEEAERLTREHMRTWPTRRRRQVRPAKAEDGS